jgi:hypothetical protein
MVGEIDLGKMETCGKLLGVLGASWMKNFSVGQTPM